MRARLLDTPASDTDWQRWGFDHQASHDAIRTAIQTIGGPALAPEVIYPIPLSQMRVFLAANQRLHLDMNSVLGQQSSDLEDVDLSDPKQVEAWVNVHYQEHFNAESTLGIGT